MITVVASLIEKDNKIFIAQRLKGKYENKWEFPGGKVESGEDEKAAVEREIKEEFELVVKAQRFVRNNIYEYPDIIIDLRLYSCEYVSGEFKLHDHKQYKWIDKKDILEYDLAPADVELAKYIKEL